MRLLCRLILQLQRRKWYASSVDWHTTLQNGTPVAKWHRGSDASGWLPILHIITSHHTFLGDAYFSPFPIMIHEACCIDIGIVYSSDVA